MPFACTACTQNECYSQTLTFSKAHLTKAGEILQTHDSSAHLTEAGEKSIVLGIQKALKISCMHFPSGKPFLHALLALACTF